MFNLFFDKVYVISLTSEIIRRKNITNNLKSLDIDFQFINAISYKKIDIDSMKDNNKIAYENNDFYCTKRCTCKGKGHYLRPTSIANQLSHELAWKYASKNKENILILEDDVLIDSNLNNLMLDYEKAFPKKWDILYFSKNGVQQSKRKFQKIKKGVSGSHMYAISSKAATIALENLYPLRAHVDGYMDRFLIRKSEFYKIPKLRNCFITQDKFGINMSYDSDVKTTMLN